MPTGKYHPLDNCMARPGSRDPPCPTLPWLVQLLSWEVVGVDMNKDPVCLPMPGQIAKVPLSVTLMDPVSAENPVDG